MGKYQKIVVSGCLIKNGKVLLIRRSINETFLPGYHELPGGKVEFGEKLEAALQREFKEEVNLQVEVVRPYHTLSYTMERGKCHTVEIIFIVKLRDSLNNINLEQDHDDYKWVSGKDIEKLLVTSEIILAIRKGLEASQLNS